MHRRVILASCAMILMGLALPMGCEQREPPGASTERIAATAGSMAHHPIPSPVGSEPSARGVEPAASTIPNTQPPAASADPSAASSSASAPAVDAPPSDPLNKTMPSHTAADLESSGKSLLAAIAADDVEVAKDFFFPRDPFTPLKDVKNPDGYWKNLYEAYRADIHKLHRRTKDWSKATFEAIEPGSAPAWVAPGEEANKIGYHRSWGTKLRYRIDGKLYTVKIHTVISWQGKWYITHLLPFKKAK